MHRIFHATLTIGILVATASSSSAQSVETPVSPGEATTKTETELSAVEQRLLELTNDFRGKQMRTPLKANDRLLNAARYFADYMSQSDKYGHEADGHRPAQRIKQHEYEHCLMAENIAYREVKREITDEATADYFFAAWRDSESHRRNMLDPDFTELGVAVSYHATTKKYYAVQLLARPSSAAIRFQVMNESKMPVGYRLSSQTESLEIKARVVRTHYSCRPLTLRLTASSDSVIKVMHDTKYVIRNVDGKLSLAK